MREAKLPALTGLQRNVGYFILEYVLPAVNRNPPGDVHENRGV